MKQSNQTVIIIKAEALPQTEHQYNQTDDTTRTALVKTNVRTNHHSKTVRKRTRATYNGSHITRRPLTSTEYHSKPQNPWKLVKVLQLS